MSVPLLDLAKEANFVLDGRLLFDFVIATACPHLNPSLVMWHIVLQKTKKE